MKTFREQFIDDLCEAGCYILAAPLIVMCVVVVIVAWIIWGIQYTIEILINGDDARPPE